MSKCSSFTLWNLQLYNNSLEWKNVTFSGGVKTYCDPYIFSGGFGHPQDLCPWCVNVHTVTPSIIALNALRSPGHESTSKRRIIDVPVMPLHSSHHSSQFITMYTVDEVNKRHRKFTMTSWPLPNCRPVKHPCTAVGHWGYNIRQTK